MQKVLVSWSGKMMFNRLNHVCSSFSKLCWHRWLGFSSLSSACSSLLVINSSVNKGTRQPSALGAGLTSPPCPAFLCVQLAGLEALLSTHLLCLTVEEKFSSSHAECTIRPTYHFVLVFIVTVTVSVLSIWSFWCLFWSCSPGWSWLL